jgi:hypothetical protein
MSRKKNDTLDELMAEFEAEDAVVNYLAELPPLIAAHVLLKVARTEMRRWEAERIEMLRRHDPRLVYLFAPEEVSWLDTALARLPQPSISYAFAERHVIKLLANLPPDAAASAAYRAARWWIVYHAGGDLRAMAVAS